MTSLIIPYQESWPRLFQQISDVLMQALMPFGVSIEHVGSTAVSGLAAKSIIDLHVVYQSENHFEKIKDALEKLNYYHNGDQGIKGREVFKRLQGSDDKVLDTTAHHLYVSLHSSEELKRHILFRDYLRSNPKVAKEYSELKNTIAEKANQHKKIYAAMKEVDASDFINDCIQKQLENGK